MAENSNTYLNIFVKVFDKATKPIEQVKKQMESLQKTQMRFLSGGLALLFTGMALERFFGGALRAMFNTYVQVINVQDIFFQKTQHLRAAWEFLKFSIIDALLQSTLMVSLIDWLINLVNWFGRLSPEARAALGIIAVGGFAGATAMAILGNAMLFIMGIAGLFGISMASALGIVVFALLLISALFFIWISGMGKAQKVVLTLVVLAGILGLVFFKAGLLATTPFLIIAALLLVLGILLFVFWDDFISGLKKWGLVARLFALQFKLGFLAAINSVIEALQEMVNFISRKFPTVSRFLGFSPTAVRGPLTSEETATRRRIAELQLEGMEIEKKQREAGREGFSSESLKMAFQEAFKDLLPDFSNAVTEGVNRSNSTILGSPST